MTNSIITEKGRLEIRTSKKVFYIVFAKGAFNIKIYNIIDYTDYILEEFYFETWNTDVKRTVKMLSCYGLNLNKTILNNYKKQRLN